MMSFTTEGRHRLNRGALGPGKAWRCGQVVRRVSPRGKSQRSVKLFRRIISMTIKRYMACSSMRWKLEAPPRV